MGKEKIIYYHGTPWKSASECICAVGLGGGKVRNGGVDKGFDPASGRSYVTQSVGNATRYAVTMSGDEPYGYVLEFSLAPCDLGVDEDDLGSIIYHYLSKDIDKLPFRMELLDYLNKEELESIRRGEFFGYASCKKIIDKLTSEERLTVLGMSPSGNATVWDERRVKPLKVYRVKRPRPDEVKELLNCRDFRKMRDWFVNNKD